jgi:glycosyltransferase involved in cell wall biosynthesis
MRVSLIMPVKNGERFIAEALDSVVAQSRPPDEVVVVDGASTDRSAEIASSYPTVRVIQQQREPGFAGAWNEGVAASRGDVLTFLDSDDLWEPSKLERQLDCFRARPEVDYVITRMRFFSDLEGPVPPGFRPELLDDDHVANMPSALAITRDAFDAVGPFVTDYTIASDIDWFARAKDLGLTLGVVPEVLVHKRVHDTNVSLVRAGLLNDEILDLLRQSVARQR